MKTVMQRNSSVIINPHHEVADCWHFESVGLDMNAALGVIKSIFGDVESLRYDNIEGTIVSGKMLVTADVLFDV